MIFGKTRIELQVGIFVFIGVVIMVVFVLSIGSFKTWTSGYNVHFIFNFVNGIKVGAPVRFSGVDAGEVKSIHFMEVPEEKKDKIKLACWVKKDVRIPLDSTIWVNTLGLLGEKYIEIMPGKDYGNFLPQGQNMEGVDPVPMHEIFRMGKNIAEVINETFTKIKNKEGTIGKLLFDEKMYDELEGFVVDIRANPWKLFWKTSEKPVSK